MEEDYGWIVNILVKYFRYIETATSKYAKVGIFLNCVILCVFNAKRNLADAYFCFDYKSDVKMAI